MSASGLLLLLFSGLLAIRFGWLGAFGLLIPFEANALFSRGFNVITADFYLLMIVVLVAVQVAAKGKVRKNEINFDVLMISIFGALVTFFAPRIFTGITVISLDNASYTLSSRLLRSPLEFSASNRNQLIYLVLHFTALASICGIIARQKSESLTHALYLAATVNIVLVLSSFVLGPRVTDFFFTASYSDLRNVGSEFGLRGVGAFREAARQGQFAATCYAYFLFAYFINGRLIDGALAVGSLFCAGLAFSSTALAGVTVATAFVCAIFFFGVGQIRISRRFFFRFILASAIFAIAVMVTLLFFPGVAETIARAFGSTLISGKIASNSGIERVALLSMSVDVMRDTWGIGCGLGCTRGNGLWFVMGANFGIIGVALLLRVFWHCVAPRALCYATPEQRRQSLPALAALITLLACLSLSLTVPNVGNFLIFILALCWAKRSGYPLATKAPIKLKFSA